MSLINYLQDKAEQLGERLLEAGKDLHQDVIEFIDDGVDELREETAELVAEIKQHFSENPEPLFKVLRAVKPILLFRDTAIVTRYDDVQEVLARDDVFHVTYAEKMHRVTAGSNFFLGMQNTATYQRDVSNMRLAAQRDDVEAIVIPLTNREAQRITSVNGGEIDLVQSLSSVIPVRLVAEYIGISGPGAPGRNAEAQIREWATILFEYLFLDPNDDPGLAQRAETAAAALRQRIDETLVARKNAAEKDDIVGRLLRLQSARMPGNDDVDIRNNLVGIIIGAIPTINKQTALVMDELLQRPEQLAQAMQAARDNNDELLYRIVREVQRFRPMAGGAFRVAAEDYELSRGNRRSVTIPKGTTVIALTASAMMDGFEMDDAQDFRTDRSDYDYMLYGYGLHTCFGQYINQAMIFRILKPLLQARRIHRAGELEMEGQWPSRLLIRFERD